MGTRESGLESLPDPPDRLTRRSILETLSKNDASAELSARALRAQEMIHTRWLCEGTMATPHWA